MKIAYNWLKQYIDLHESAHDIGTALTSGGLEVEGIEEVEAIRGGLRGLVVGEVLTCVKHPSADKLSKTTVRISADIILPIVCGAPNVAAGQKVIVATVGTQMYPKAGESFTISKAKIRGEVSEGMLCGADEIGVGDSQDGIIVLDAQYAVGTPAAEVYGMSSDYVFEIGLTPNRADAASHLGVARDLVASLDRPLKPLATHTACQSGSSAITITNQQSAACPRYTGVAIYGVTVAPSPTWLRDSLVSIGLHPINNVVDITNYILHGLGQPMHAFDLDVIGDDTIIIDYASAGETLTTLDGKDRLLTARDLTIRNGSKALAIAGVMGGKESGVSSETKNIFLESAYFAADVVRKSSLQHTLKTDASFRFERGTDPNMPATALLRAIDLITELCGGHAEPSYTDLYPAPVADHVVETSISRIQKLIGKKIDADIIVSILQNLQIKITANDGDKLSLLVPPYKVDVTREADIVEEVLRIYGYDNVELSDTLATNYIANFPAVSETKLKSSIAKDLAAMGFYEMMNNSLTKKAYSVKLGKESSDVVLLNSLSDELEVMRQSLLFSGLEAIVHNINRRQKNLKLFEIGKTYHKIADKYQENTVLAIFITGAVQAESWQAPSSEVAFQHIKNTVLSILSKNKIVVDGLNKITSPTLSIAADLIVKNNIIGTIGLVDPAILKMVDCKQPVYYAEISFRALYKAASKGFQYQEINKYPEVRRDLSLVVDKQVDFAQIKAIALKAIKNTITEINVFDVYEGKNLGEGKKSYSVSYILEDKEQTLTDTKIDSTMAKLIAVYESEIGAVIRK